MIVSVHRRSISAAAQSRKPNTAIMEPSATGMGDAGFAPVAGTGGVGAEATVIVAEDVSLDGFGSVCVSPDFVAVFLITPAAASRTVICRVAVASTGSDPTVHSPPAGS